MNQQDKDRLRESAGKVVDRSKTTQSGDMDFHQAANPAAILSLLEENEALSQKAARWDWICRHWKTLNVKFNKDGLTLKSLTLTVDANNQGAEGSPRMDSIVDQGIERDTAMQHKGD